MAKIVKTYKQIEKMVCGHCGYRRKVNKKGDRRRKKCPKCGDSMTATVTSKSVKIKCNCVRQATVATNSRCHQTGKCSQCVTPK